MLRLRSKILIGISCLGIVLCVMVCLVKFCKKPEDVVYEEEILEIQPQEEEKKSLAKGSIVKYKDYVYYVAEKSKDPANCRNLICKIGEDNIPTVVFNPNAIIDNEIYIEKDIIYYTLGNKLNSINLFGENHKDILSGIVWNMYDDGVLYTSNNKLKYAYMDYEGSKIKEEIVLHEELVKFLGEYNGNIYFCNMDSPTIKVYCMNLETKEIKESFQENEDIFTNCGDGISVNDLIVYDDYIYYSVFNNETREGMIRRYSKNYESQKTIISNIESVQKIAYNRIYFYSNPENPKLCEYNLESEKLRNIEKTPLTMLDMDFRSIFNEIKEKDSLIQEGEESFLNRIDKYWYFELKRTDNNDIPYKKLYRVQENGSNLVELNNVFRDVYEDLDFSVKNNKIDLTKYGEYEWYVYAYSDTLDDVNSIKYIDVRADQGIDLSNINTKYIFIRRNEYRNMTQIITLKNDKKKEEAKELPVYNNEENKIDLEYEKLESNDKSNWYKKKDEIEYPYFDGEKIDLGNEWGKYSYTYLDDELREVKAWPYRAKSRYIDVTEFERGSSYYANLYIDNEKVKTIQVRTLPARCTIDGSKANVTFSNGAHYSIGWKGGDIIKEGISDGKTLSLKQYFEQIKENTTKILEIICYNESPEPLGKGKVYTVCIDINTILPSN